MTVQANRTPRPPVDLEGDILAFVQGRTRARLTPEVDLFASGLVSSLFAMELLVYLEQTYGVSVEGPDLKLDNFRTVDAMAALVLRLRGAGR